MPTGRKFNKKAGKWEKVTKEVAFDYDNTDFESGAILLNFFRTFPDIFLDMIESENADFSLSLPQRVMLRGFAQFKEAYFTSFRGLGKTYTVILSIMVDGILYPGEIARYYAPSQKMSAELAAVAFHQIEKNYPLLAQCWHLRSETRDTFLIETEFGSNLGIGAIQGGNCSQIIVEEIGQETEPKFDFTEYESKVIPTCRIGRLVNKRKDPMHLNPHFKYITNASRRVNPAYSKFRAKAYKSMTTAPFGSGICLDMSWEIGVICGIRSTEYVENLRASMTKEDFLRQMCATYTGTAQNPMISDEDISMARKIRIAETRHCGDPNVIYVIGHDVSYENGTMNAKCASVVVKLSEFDEETAKTKRDKYKKEIVYVDNYPPPGDASVQAARLRQLWERFSLDGGNPTYIAIDSWQYGRSVLEALVKPHESGVNLCCIDHLEESVVALEQKGALPVIYPVKAGGAGTRDPDYEIIKYARIEFEQGNVLMLTSDIFDGLEQYKRKHGIKTDEADISILQPYYKTNELCEQIMNLRVGVTGTGEREIRISLGIQRDSWSAAKYALWLARRLELEVAITKARNRSSRGEEAEKELQILRTMQPNAYQQNNVVANLLKLRGAWRK